MLTRQTYPLDEGPPRQENLLPTMGRAPRRQLTQSSPGAPAREPPLQPGPLVGREQLLTDTADLLLRPDVCLVSLVGMGGVGKTRVAIALAERLRPQFAGGVYFVDLTRVRALQQGPAAVRKILEQAWVHTGVEPDGPPLDEFRYQVPQPTEPVRCLVVLDTFEHILPAAHQIAALLATGPDVTFLVTSRSRLRLRWEHVIHVPPLDLPAEADSVSAARVRRAPAVQLFEVRAQAVDPEFRITAGNAAAVAELCALLDGVPLAIEHAAAAAAGGLSPQAIVERLHRRLDLPSAAVDLPRRQRSLRHSALWSCNLLPRDLKKLFARLAVFEGGFTPAAADAICLEGGAARAAAGVLEGLQALVDRSLLVRREGAEGAARFRMPQTIRTYAREHLAATGEREAVSQRHAAYYLALARVAETRLVEPRQAGGCDELVQERYNFDAALSWTIESGDAGTALGLSAALWRSWRARATAADSRRHLSGLMALAETKPAPSTLAGALLGAAVLAERASDYQEAFTIFARSAAVANLTRNGNVQWHAQLGASRALASAGNILGARALCERAMERLKREGDERGEADALHSLGSIAFLQKDPALARDLYWRGLKLFREWHDAGGEARALLGLGQCAGVQRDYATAELVLEQSRSLSDQAADACGVAAALIELGHAALNRDDEIAARSYCAAGLTAAARAEDRPQIAAALLVCAALAAAIDQPARALRLASAAEALCGPPRGELIDTPYAWWMPTAARHLKRAKQLLGEAAAGEAEAVGRTVPLKQAIADALALASPSVGQEATGALATSSRALPMAIAARDTGTDDDAGDVNDGSYALLTPREREIAASVAQGLTNRQIAARLIISERTVDTHMEHILKKLGLRSRAQVAVWTTTRRLLDDRAAGHVLSGAR